LAAWLCVPLSRQGSEPRWGWVGSDQLAERGPGLCRGPTPTPSSLLGLEVEQERVPGLMHSPFPEWGP
jgi:hypothetical protein